MNVENFKKSYLIASYLLFLAFFMRFVFIYSGAIKDKSGLIFITLLSISQLAGILFATKDYNYNIFLTPLKSFIWKFLVISFLIVIIPTLLLSEELVLLFVLLFGLAWAGCSVILLIFALIARLFGSHNIKFAILILAILFLLLILANKDPCKYSYLDECYSGYAKFSGNSEHCEKIEPQDLDYQDLRNIGCTEYFERFDENGVKEKYKNVAPKTLIEGYGNKNIHYAKEHGFIGSEPYYEACTTLINYKLQEIIEDCQNNAIAS